MKPAHTLAESHTSGGQTLALVGHDGQFYLLRDGVQLQSSFAHNAATELGRLAAQPFRSARQPRILLAGLGLGFTLAALREALPQKKAFFQVAEPLAELPGWHRQHLDDLHPGQLSDPRLVLSRQTLSGALRQAGEEFQAIVIDAESGLPVEGATKPDGVPRSSFLQQAHSALKGGGLFAISCGAEPRSFERKLRRAGFDVAQELVPISAKGKQKKRATIWLARKGAYQPRSSRGAHKK